MKTITVSVRLYFALLSMFAAVCGLTIEILIATHDAAFAAPWMLRVVYGSGVLLAAFGAFLVERWSSLCLVVNIGILVLLLFGLAVGLGGVVHVHLG